VWQTVFDIAFPAQCAACDAIGTGLCDRCFDPSTAPLHRRLQTIAVTALGSYDGALRRAVLALKDGRRDVARALGQRLAPLAGSLRIVPVPTTLVRRRERGFDGCSLVARCAAPADRVLDALCQAAGDSQRGRRRTQRLAATGRFRWHGEPLRGERVMLLDDVVTTGATLEDCAREIRRVGGVVDRALVVAIAT
jgi:predicted amidophosphoribosyltransferase